MGRKNQVLTILFCALLLLACNTRKKTSTPSLEIRKKTAVLETDTLLTRLFASSPKLARFLDSPVRNDIQVIYTQVDRDDDNKPVFIHHYFNVDPNRYFYPASTVKLPISVLALQKLRELRISGLDRSVTMITLPGYQGLPGVFNDPTTSDGRPTVEQYIKKILLVSDNDAFNRLYEFLGQVYINEQLKKMGYDSVQISHRLSISLNEEQNRYTNPVEFYSQSNKLLYTQPLVYSNTPYHQRSIFMGNGFMRNGQLVKEPFEFTKKNRLTLPDLHSIVQSLIFPEEVRAKSRFHLEDEDYSFLRKYMSMFPGESDYPLYDSSRPYDRSFFFEGNDLARGDLRMFNKVGAAYGFLIDAAYVVDHRTGIEFFLSAVIHCNSDGIYNDDRYDYQTVGYPFMKELARIIYSHELNRPRTRKPDLSDFKINYRD